MRMVRSTAAALVAIVAGMQLLGIGLFATLSISGDEYGIARAMAALLGLPFVCLTLPALLLLRWDRHGWTGLLAILSVSASYLLWRFA